MSKTGQSGRCRSIAAATRRRRSASTPMIDEPIRAPHFDGVAAGKAQQPLRPLTRGGAVMLAVMAFQGRFNLSPVEIPETVHHGV